MYDDFVAGMSTGIFFSLMSVFIWIAFVNEPECYYLDKKSNIVYKENVKHIYQDAGTSLKFSDETPSDVKRAAIKMIDSNKSYTCNA